MSDIGLLRTIIILINEHMFYSRPIYFNTKRPSYGIFVFINFSK